MKPGDLVAVYPDSPNYYQGTQKPECVGLYVRHISSGSFEYEGHEVFANGKYLLYRVALWWVVPYTPTVQEKQ